MYAEPLGADNEPSFFRDVIIFSKQEQRDSLKARILSNLESWLSVSLLPSNKLIFKIRSFYDCIEQKKCYTIESKDKIHLSKRQRAYFITLKILATLFIFPRAIAEILRFTLRKSFIGITKKKNSTKIQNLAGFRFKQVTQNSFKENIITKNSDLKIEEILSFVASFKNDLVNQRSIKGVSYLPSKSYRVIFEKESHPNFIFKIPLSFIEKVTYPEITTRKLTKEIYNNNTIQQAIKILELSHLSVPNKQLLQSDSKEDPLSIIMEEKLTIPTNHDPWAIYNRSPDLCIPAFIELGCLLSTTSLKYTGLANFPLNYPSQDSVTMNILGTKHSTYLSTSYTPIFQIKRFCKDLPNIKCIVAVLKVILSNDKYLPTTCNKEIFCAQIVEFMKSQRAQHSQDI